MINNSTINNGRRVLRAPHGIPVISLSLKKKKVKGGGEINNENKS